MRNLYLALLLILANCTDGGVAHKIGRAEYALCDVFASLEDCACYFLSDGYCFIFDEELTVCKGGPWVERHAYVCGQDDD